VSLLTFNALLASSEVVIPVDPSRYSLQAVRKLKETLGVLRETKSHDLIPHVLMSNFETRSRFSRSVATELEAHYGGELFDTILHHTVRVQEAAGAGIPVLKFDSGSRSALDFRNFAHELVEQEVDIGVSALDHWLQLLHGPEVAPGQVRFVVDFPRAKSVLVTGSFCHWAVAGVPLQRSAEGYWECVVDMPPGEQQYRFIVDGEWRSDPHNCDRVVNEFGQANSRVLVT
jgi:hypothetical protein